MALSARSSHTMASIDRSSVRTQTWTEQVAEPSNDRACALTPLWSKQSTILIIFPPSLRVDLLKGFPDAPCGYK